MSLDTAETKPGLTGAGAPGASTGARQPGQPSEKKPAVLPPWMVRSVPAAGAAGSGAPGAERMVQEDRKDVKGAHSAEQEAIRAAYVAQYMATLARAQAEKQEQLRKVWSGIKFTHSVCVGLEGSSACFEIIHDEKMGSQTTTSLQMCITSGTPYHLAISAVHSNI